MSAPPSPSTASLSSLVTALSEADETVQSARLLFSPKSARTNGTGATGSTEPVGQATRSLFRSVDGRGGAEEAYPVEQLEEEGEDARDARLGSPVVARSRMSEETEWTQLSGREALRASEAACAAVQLPTPEPELLIAAPVDSIAVHIKEESDDGLAAHAALAQSPPPSRHASPPYDALTDSQEDALLAQSVTRSQSDFSHWLEETLRLARGDGSSSTIESDDALSSIIEATRHAQLGWAASSRMAEDSEVESLSEEGPILPDEDITLTTVRTRETVVEGDAEDVMLEEVVEEADEPAPTSEVTQSAALPSPAPSAYGWKALSLALAAALAYSLKQHADLAVAAKIQPEPTRALHLVPLNETTAFSQFATPIPVGSPLSLPVYALFCTFAAGIAASIPLLRRRRAQVASRPACSTRSRSRSLSGTPPARNRATSPLLELNGDALLAARALLPLGVEQYALDRLSDAVATFGSIVALPCTPADKAVASEWLGRALYRLARADGNDPERLEQAAAAFERAIRLDGGRATPRASLGRVKYRQGDAEGAVASLRAALKRDENLAIVHEYLAKALAKLGPCPADAARLVEEHLVRAIDFDPLSYTTLAYLGEFLHLSGGGQRLADARTYLERAVALRADYPAAHARLAFIANETLDAPTAAAHYAAVIATRHTGLRDAVAMPASERACEGTAPFLGWTFVTPPRSVERRAVLTRAAAEHPHDDLVALLLAIEQSPPSPGAGPAPALLEREAALARRAERFTVDEDLPAHGLWALALLALGRSDDAQRVYGSFWSTVAARRSAGTGEVDRTIAFLAMAFYEVKGLAGARPAPGKNGRKAQVGTPKRAATRAVKREEAMPLAVEQAPVTVLRRSPRRTATAAQA